MRARSGVEQQLGGSVVELIGVHRLDEAQVVRHARQVRQHAADPGSALAVLFELMRRAEQLRRSLDEREPLSFE